MIARRLVMGLLALGVVGGYGSAARQFIRARREWHQKQFEGSVSRACADAARAEVRSALREQRGETLKNTP